MRDKALENRIEEIKELMKIWMRFYNLLTEGFSPETITPQREQEFLQIKTVVAERHAHFMEVISGIKEYRELYIGQNVLALVKRTISLADFAGLSAVEINKISIEWHDANILLNECLGVLEQKRDALAKVNATQFKFQQAIKTIKTRIRRFTQTGLFKFLVFLLVVGILSAVCYVYREQITKQPLYQSYGLPVVNYIRGLLHLK